MGAFEFINGAAIVVVPDMLDFGELLPGESRTASLHIANGGMGMLSGEVAGVQTPFTALDSAHYVIAAGTGMPMRFCFSPLWEDTYSNTVAFSGGCGAQAVLTGSAIPEPAVALALASAAIIRARRALL